MSEHEKWFAYGFLVASAADLALTFMTAFVRAYVRRTRELRAEADHRTEPTLAEETVPSDERVVEVLLGRAHDARVIRIVDELTHGTDDRPKRTKD